MTHNRFSLLTMLIASCSFALAACSLSYSSPDSPPSQAPSNQASKQETADSTASATRSEGGSELDAIASAERVVTLTSLTADLVYRLDRSKLIGVPGSRLIAGDERFDGIEIVSSGRTPPNLERIVALNPDLVIGAMGFHESTAERLNDAGISTLLTRVDSWDSLQDLTETLANVLDADATDLLQRYETCSSDTPAEASLSTLVLVSYQPILSPNQNSWAGDFLKRFNIQNLMADVQPNSSGSPSGQQFEGYVSLSPEKILEANPGRVFVVNTQEDILQQFEANPFWQELDATQTGNIYTFDYYGLINPGSLQSINDTCTRLSQLSSE